MRHVNSVYLCGVHYIGMACESNTALGMSMLVPETDQHYDVLSE